MAAGISDVARTTRGRVTLHVALLVLAFALAALVAAFPGVAPTFSAWWPAVAVCVLALLALPRRYRPAGAAAAAVVVASANLVCGMTPVTAVGLGLANGAEALVVATVLVAGRRRARLGSLRDVGRLLLAIGVGVVVGELVAGAATVLDGGTFLDGAANVLTSHASALVMILPLGLRTPVRRGPAPVVQQVLQLLVLAAVVYFVFGPSTPLPMTFLVVPVLVWATFIYSSRVVAVEVALTGVAVTQLTLAGHGPFAYALRAFGPVPTAQIFLMVVGATILAFAAARDERLAISARLAKRDQVLHGGLIAARVGLVVLHESSATEIVVLEANARASELLGGEVPRTVDDPLEDVDDADRPRLAIDDGRPFARAVLATRRAPHGEWFGEVEAADGHHIELFLTRVVHPTHEIFITAQIVDVTQRHRADVAMRNALEAERDAAARLREVNRQKDDFLSAVSHELRTPITSIVGYTELLADDTDLDDEQTRYLEVVERNARRLGVLVEDLLEHGAGAARNEREESATAIDEAVRHTVEELTPSAAQRGVRLVLGPRTGLVVRAARTDVVRILTNLVSNALKFTPPDGSVTVGVTAADGDGVLVTVTDTGPGIAPDDLERVFDRFFRSATAEEGSVPGVGLGLALVKSLVERNEGEIELVSDGRHGTEARVTLRRASAERDAEKGTEKG